MISTIKNIASHHELLVALTWKNIAVRYKQAYLGIALAVLKPTLLMLIFTLVRSFVGIETGNTPYPVLTFAALIPWVFFQEATSESINSVVGNGILIKKIYFPREILPLTSLVTKSIELMINFMILGALMLYYDILPGIEMVWVPLIIIYAGLFSLSISFTGSAMNVYYRDINNLLPIFLNLLMYATPIIYPLELVRKKLLLEQAAGEWSDFFFFFYTSNPLVGIVHSFQNVMLKGKLPDMSVIWPGLIITCILLPISFLIFKRAEVYFADII